MIMRELEAMLTLHSGYQPGEIDQRMRPLREHNLVPHGPRGRGAFHIEPLHACLGLLTMVSRRATDAGAVAMRAMDLKLVPRAGVDIAANTTLPVLLAAGIQAGGIIKRIEIFCDGSMAWATMAIGKKTATVLLTDDRKVAAFVKAHPETYDAQGRHYCGHRMAFAGEFLDVIRLAMTEEDAGAGYAGDKKAKGRRPATANAE